MNDGIIEQLQDGGDLGVLKTVSITASALTSGRVPYASANGLLVDNPDLTFDGTILSVSKIIVDTSGIDCLISSRHGTNSVGYNIWIGGGGESAIGVVGQTYRGAKNTSLGHQALLSITTGYANSAFGAYALYTNTTGINNVAIGVDSLRCNEDGSGNVAIGSSALVNNISGNNNFALGTTALKFLENGVNNVAIGVNAGRNIAENYNIAIGTQALQTTTGSANVAIGQSALNATTGSGSVAIGHYAGRYETGSNKFFIDNTYRGGEADARIKALVYGVFAAAAVDQDFIFNAQVGVNITPSAWLTLRAGSAAAGTAPLKLTSGTLLTTPEVCAIECLTDKLYFTITTGAARKEIVLTEGLTSGRIPYVANGRLTDNANIQYDGTNVILSDLKYPNADGDANQVLKTDGSGNLSWSTGNVWSETNNHGSTVYKCQAVFIRSSGGIGLADDVDGGTLYVVG